MPSLDGFAWQGCATSSVSKSQEEAVRKYIASQAEHHRKEGIQAELLWLRLDRTGARDLTALRKLARVSIWVDDPDKLVIPQELEGRVVGRRGAC